MKYYLEIVRISNQEVVKTIGPFQAHEQEKVEAGALRNLDQENYFIRTVQK